MHLQPTSLLYNQVFSGEGCLRIKWCGNIVDETVLLTGG